MSTICNIILIMTTISNIIINGKASDLRMEDGRIVRIAPACTLEGGEIIDGKGKTAFPSFVNMHTHSGMAPMRGIWEDLALSEWLPKVWALEAKIDGEFIYHATRLACLEMIKTGTTCFNDMYWFQEDAARAVAEMGLRGAVSYVILDNFDKDKIKQQREECIQMYESSKKWGETVIFAISCHAVYTVSEENLVWAAGFTREHGIPLHVHVSETEQEVLDCTAAHGGLSPVEYLDSLGVLGSNVIAAHTLWLSDRDVEIMGRNGVTCVHNINSNLKLASGYHFLSKELAEAGANVTLGTDGSSSSNNLDMLEAMKTSAIMQKAWRRDPTAMPIEKLIECATVNGARSMGLECGRLEEGMLADFILVDTDNCFFLSPGSFESNFIYSAHSDCITDLVCNGRFLMRDRKVEGEKEILENARTAISKII